MDVLSGDESPNRPNVSSGKPRCKSPSPRRPTERMEEEPPAESAAAYESDADNEQTPRRQSRLTAFFQTPFAKFRALFCDGDQDQVESEAEVTNGKPAEASEVTRGPLTRTRSKNGRFHLSVSPKQPDIREMLRTKKKSNKPQAKSSGVGADKDKVNSKSAPSDNAPKTTKSRKKLLGDSSKAMGKTPCSAPPTLRSHKIKDKTLPLDRGMSEPTVEISASSTSQPRTSTLKDAKKSECRDATKPKNGNEEEVKDATADKGRDELASPSRSPVRKRRRSASPDAGAKAKKSKSAAAETTARKRRHSMPSINIVKDVSKATSSTSTTQVTFTKKAKNSLPAMPTDPHEAFALYMSEGDSPSEVLPGLWLGGFNAWYRGDSLVGSECREVDNVPFDMFFREHNISHVVSLGPWRPECENFPGILEEVAHLDIDDCSCGDDLPAQTLREDFDRLVTQLCRWRLDNRNVFVHCRAGQSRSATILIAYYAVVFNFSVHDALAHLYQMRPGPRGVCPGAQFLKALVDWEKSDLCQNARARYAEEVRRKERMMKDVEFLADGWQKDCTDDEFTNGFFTDLVLPFVPDLVFDSRKHLRALTKLALSLC